MVEASSGNADLVAKLKQMGDWHRSAIISDTKEVVAQNECPLLPDEIE